MIFSIKSNSNQKKKKIYFNCFVLNKKFFFFFYYRYQNSYKMWQARKKHLGNTKILAPEQTFFNLHPWVIVDKK